MSAVQSGDERMASLLISKGARLDGQIKTLGPLHMAVSRRRPAMAKFLLDRGSKVDPIDAYENTPLILAAKSGQLDVVRLLLDRGANPGMRDQSGRTALDAARAQGHMDIVKLLEAK
jgi:uncharacterized protein